LIKLNLIEKDETNSVAKFKVNHPSNLENLLNKKEEEIQTAKKELNLVIKNLTSDYNLLFGKPGVQVFEGEEGVKKVLEDSLKTKDEILTYADVEPIVTKIKKINDDYVKKRLKLGIKKRAMVLNTPFAQKYMKENYTGKITDTRFLSNGDTIPFSAFVEIYDDKIAYITFENDKLIGIIIQNPEIAKINKYLFEFA
jgi:sugar-specific transcriptional regulator TrmB